MIPERKQQQVTQEQSNTEVTYSAKFLRYIRISHEPWKLSSEIFFQESLNREHYFREMLPSSKIMHLGNFALYGMYVYMCSAVDKKRDCEVCIIYELYIISSC